MCICDKRRKSEGVNNHIKCSQVAGLIQKVGRSSLEASSHLLRTAKFVRWLQLQVTTPSFTSGRSVSQPSVVHSVYIK